MKIEFDWVPVDHLAPNPWNPNEMTPFIYAKEIASIREHGMIDPVLVRSTQLDHPPYYQIIDGEHRWRASRDLGMTHIPVASLGVISDATAKQLTITMNELRGTANPGRMSDLLKELASMTPLEELIDKLPFSEEAFTAMTGLGELPSLPEAAPSPSLGPVASGGESRRWVERTYRLPPEVAAVLDDAISTARIAMEDGAPVQDWQALEMVAAEFLATYQAERR